MASLPSLGSRTSSRRPPLPPSSVPPRPARTPPSPLAPPRRSSASRSPPGTRTCTYISAPQTTLTHHLRLVEDALDADEALAQRLTLDHVHIPLARQPLARSRPLRADHALHQQQREQMSCGQRHFRLVLSLALCFRLLVTRIRTGNLNAPSKRESANLLQE